MHKERCARIEFGMIKFLIFSLFSRHLGLDRAYREHLRTYFYTQVFLSLSLNGRSHAMCQKLQGFFFPVDSSPGCAETAQELKGKKHTSATQRGKFWLFCTLSRVFFPVDFLPGLYRDSPKTEKYTPLQKLHLSKKRIDRSHKLLTTMADPTSLTMADPTSIVWPTRFLRGAELLFFSRCWD